MEGTITIKTAEAVKLIVEGLKLNGINLPDINPEHVIFVFGEDGLDFLPVIECVKIFFNTKGE